VPLAGVKAVPDNDSAGWGDGMNTPCTVYVASPMTKTHRGRGLLKKGSVDQSPFTKMFNEFESN